MKPLNFAPFDGLRGFLAIYILLYHCLVLSDATIDIQGWSVMPLFYCLSGFMIHYVERMKQPKEQIREAELRLLEQQDSKDPATEAEEAIDIDLVSNGKFNMLRFYLSRASRILPTYYFSLLLSLPLWFLGYGARNPSNFLVLLGPVLTSFIPTVSWVNIPLRLGGCLNVPAWTISTLAFFWLLIYPYKQKLVQNLENERLVSSIARIFWFNGLSCLLGLFVLSRFYSFAVACEVVFTSPPFRTTLFEAGVYAAELAFRAEHTSMDWCASTALLFPSLSWEVSWHCFAKAVGQVVDEEGWVARADRQAALLVGLFAFATALDTYLRLGLGYESSYAIVWLQLLVPFSALELVVALARDIQGGRSAGEAGGSWCSSLLQASWLQYLGKRGLCIYLLHYPLLLYTLCLIYGTRGENWSDSLPSLPLWAIPVVIVATLLLSIWLHNNVELPMRKKFAA
eukprot:gene25285-30534_t